MHRYLYQSVCLSLLPVTFTSGRESAWHVPQCTSTTGVRIVYVAISHFGSTLPRLHWEAPAFPRVRHLQNADHEALTSHKCPEPRGPATAKIGKLMITMVAGGKTGLGRVSVPASRYIDTHSTSVFCHSFPSRPHKDTQDAYMVMGTAQAP